MCSIQPVIRRAASERHTATKKTYSCASSDSEEDEESDFDDDDEDDDDDGERLYWDDGKAVSQQQRSSSNVCPCQPSTSPSPSGHVLSEYTYHSGPTNVAFEGFLSVPTLHQVRPQ